jgi:hypothetical protein
MARKRAVEVDRTAESRKKYCSDVSAEPEKADQPSPTQKPSYDAKISAAHLQKHSYVVLNFLSTEELSAAHTEFLAFVAAQPERTPGSTGLDIAGGFGCFGTASSFHNPLVRRLRLRLHAFLHDLLQALAPGRKFESVIDRLMYRQAGVRPSPESVHRDQSKGLLPEDLCFGGALNLNLTETQHFSLQPGTHLAAGASSAPAGTGFTREKQAAVKAEFNRRKQSVAFGPGQFMLFYENVLHEVRNAKLPFDVMRLFHGIRVTDAASSLYPDNAQLCAEEQGVVRYKGGELPRMVPKLWLVNWLSKWVAFSGDNRWLPGMLYDHTVKSSGAVLQGVVRPIAPSLRALGRMYPDYTAQELAILKPQPL